MPNDFDTAEWADSRHHLNQGIHRLIHKLSYVFERLAAIEYDAPWRHLRP